ncbi:GTPase IMAP family member 9-like [Hoplias malabaricus]|uniref:GTPase IMAP family member 9-like n=1 Tax=Hoplias malabaricus TaxID=27720 RepID=UPI0034636007
MGKTREDTIRVKQMCVDLHKSRSGYKKIATHLHMPSSTVREIIKEFKTSGTVTNCDKRAWKRTQVTEVKKNIFFILLLLFSTLLSFVSELRIVLLGKVGAGKSKVARLLLGSKEPKGEIGSCVLREGEARGRRICLVDTPDWGRYSLYNTPDKIKHEMARSMTLCPPGPHALIVVLRVKSCTDGPSVKELKTLNRRMELLSERVWKHTMVLFLCDEEVEEPAVRQYIQKANRLLEKCGNRHYVLRSEDQVPGFLQEIDKMVEGNCGDFFLPQMYYEYMQSKIPKNITEMKKMYEDREERLKMGYQTRINQYKRQAEETVLRQRRGSFQGDRPSMNEDDQPVDIAAIKSKFRDEMMSLARYYMKPAALIALTIIGALIGSVVGSAYGVTGSGVGIVIGIAVAIPLALWLIDAVRVARESSNTLQETKHHI